MTIAALAQAAYAATDANATAAEQAAVPPTIAVQGGPLYAGVNGAPTRQWRNGYRVLPRLGFSYQIKSNTVIGGGYGIFFDTLNALEWPGPTDPTNFTATTIDFTSSYYGNFGQNLSAATPPIANPFPTTNESNFQGAVGPARVTSPKFEPAPQFTRNSSVQLARSVSAPACSIKWARPS